MALPESWRVDPEIEEHVREIRRRSLDVYRIESRRVRQDAMGEWARAQGGYAHRQFVELLQNAIDSLEVPGGRVEVVVSGDRVYCADSGAPFTSEGVDGITGEYEGTKSGDDEKIGQFGLGFRALVALSDRVDVFSSTISLGFDRDANEDAVASLGLSIDEPHGVPLFRLPVVRDISDAAAEDSMLDGLLQWASTVIRMELRDESAIADSIEQLRSTDQRILLFSLHLDDLVISVGDERRAFTATREDEVVLLGDGHDVEEWKVFQRVGYQPSVDALDDVGDLARREKVTLSWALRDQIRGSGEVWLYFPTQWEMSAPGILNAPWKPDDSRRNLIEGEWNDELFRVAAGLIVDSLPSLATSDDPALAITALPEPSALTSAVGFDAVLVNDIYRLASTRKLVPDVDGQLRVPEEIRLPPSVAPLCAVERLYASPSCDHSRWAHPGLLRGKARRRLVALAPQQADGLEDWFSWIVEDRTAQASIDALGVVGCLRDDEEWGEKHREQLDLLEDIPCVLAADGATMLPLDPVKVFLASPVSDADDSMVVHPDVAADSGAADVLAAAGIRPAGALAALTSFLQSGWPDAEAAWRTFWELVAMTTLEEFESVLDDQGRRDVKVAVAGGQLRPVWEVLRGGPIASADREPDVVIDEEYHAGSLEHLARVGVVALPVKGTQRAFGERNDWREEDAEVKALVAHAVSKFLRTPGYYGSWPQAGYERIRSHPTVRPLSVLSELSEESATEFTRRMIDLAPHPPNWSVVHSTTPNRYPATEFRAPEVEALRNHGIIETSLGPQPFRYAVGAGLATAEQILPVVSDLNERAAQAYEVPWRWEEVPAEILEHAFRIRLSSDSDEAVTVAIEAARGGAHCPMLVPAMVDGTWGLHPSCDVVVATDPVPYAIRALGRPVLIVGSSDSVEILAEAWGLSSEGAEDPVIDADPRSEPVSLISRFPWLMPHLGDLGAQLSLVQCSRLEIYSKTDVNQARVELRSIHYGDEWYYDSRLVDDQVVAALLDDLGRRDLIDQVPQLRYEFEAQFTYDRIEAARSVEGDAEKLAVLFGRAPLEQQLGQHMVSRLSALLGDPPSEVQLAQALIAIRGDAVLRYLSAALKGIDAPVHFAGGATVSRFVQMLGLGSQYAGAPRKAEPTDEEVPGPLKLPPLHSFQEPLVSEVEELILQGERGILWLPTGAGKTRVAMQGLAHAARSGKLTYPIVWIAAREELCEQAIASLKQTWGVAGPDHAITVSRLWDGRTVAPVGGPHLVVATIQTLRKAINEPYYGWLRDTGCIVIDEAHRSITDSYEDVAEIANQSGVAFLGLTATPFRGSGYEETHKLASQYDYRLLESEELLPDPMAVLRDRNILATAHHGTIAGSTIDLTDKELEHLERFADPSPDLERRLAADTSRNERLVEQILHLDATWPVIVFALSVDHAELLAAALEASGRPSRAISGTTERFARRSMVEEFRHGKVKVLTNYEVFGEGFDAPSVKAVVIARPTFSPVLYQQMIGRGLRGKKQGGTDECWIYDVDDNIKRFKRKLAFTEFRAMFRTNRRTV